MAQTTARGQVTITDLTDGASIFCNIQALKGSASGSSMPETQVYDKDKKTFTPDWSKAGEHLFLMPVVSISTEGGSANQANKLTSGIWKLNNVAIGTALTSDQYVLGSKAEGYPLTVKVNTLSDNLSKSQDVFTFEGVYTDSYTSLTTNIRSSVTFTRIDNAGNLFFATITSVGNDGYVFMNSEVKLLRAKAVMNRGTQEDAIGVRYRWAVASKDVFAQTTTSAPASASSKTVSLENIENVESGSRMYFKGSSSKVYTVASVNVTDKTVVLTEGLSVALTAGDKADSADYSVYFGSGWKEITATAANSANDIMWVSRTDNQPVVASGPDNATAIYGGDQINIPVDSVDNFETVKVICYDLDPTSSTAGQNCSDIQDYIDYTDPYLIELDYPADTLKNGQGSIPIIPFVTQNGDILETQPDAKKFSWVKYDKNGSLSTTWRNGSGATNGVWVPPTSGTTPESRKLTITRADVDVRSTFRCTVSLI